MKPVTVLMTSLSACAALVAAGCGGAGDSATTTDSAVTRAAAAVAPTPPWNCTEALDPDDGTMRLEYLNNSSRRVVLRADQPADCAPWGSNGNPGQVNATGAIEPGGRQLVTLLYDGFTDESGTTAVTPVPIAIRVLGATPTTWAATTPGIVLVRTVDSNGRYTRRNFFLRKDGQDTCSGTVPIKALSPPNLVGTFTCRSTEIQTESAKPALLIIQDAPG